jgi:hypothetical protein
MKPSVFRVAVPLDLGTSQPDIVLKVSGVGTAPYQKFRVAPEPVQSPAPSPTSSSDGSYLKRAEPVILQKQRVRFVTAAGLVNELVEAQHHNLLGRRWRVGVVTS